jgi:quercetin dioxygenase-like cupin family protein
VLRGRLEVLIGDTSHILEQGDYLTVPAGARHTFATVDQTGAQVFVVMTHEVDQLIQALHTAATDEERAEVWARYHSEPVELPDHPTSLRDR